MTKTQVKSALRKLLEKLEEVKDELNDLNCEIEDTRDNIEPYEYADELTPEQEERIDWLDDAYGVIDEVITTLEEDVQYRLEEIY